ncbi:MAG TPA: 2-dehydro-3-deoxygalactonokinase [Mesorhizobium sp.]|nr:2-dehydro-3-deoxygalactonokinase [Mesorhizobium sp.]
MSAPAFAAVDWGTSRIRVYLMDRAGAVLRERRSDDGMASAGGRFGDILESHLAALQAPENLPVIVCGMAGARGGWVEAPYVPTPASLTDLFDGAVHVPHPPRPVRILPGVAQHGAEPNVMRGEETKLAGVSHRLEGAASVVCMPGTHAKWVEAGNAAIRRFDTFLTGELFAVLSRHSLLARTLGADEHRVDPENEAFRRAVRQALTDGGLVGRLFSIRAASLLAGLSAQDAAATLSGLLIGSEIFSARSRFVTGTAPVLLVATGGLAALYAAALEMAGIAHRTVDADEAVLRGLFEAAHHLLGDALEEAHA